jgi:hypothetical protein
MICHMKTVNSILAMLLIGSLPVSGQFYSGSGHQGGEYGSGGDKKLDVEVLNLKVYLAGCYSGGSMLTALNVQGLLPLQQPFDSDSSAYWFYAGTESVDSIPGDSIVDWIYVELRETAGGPATALPDSVIGRRAGFLLSDGTITDLDGISELRFKYLKASDSLYAIVRHRNHLAVMNATPLILNSEIRTWDFTDDPAKAYHESGFTNNEPSAGLGAGKHGLWPGNAMPDNVVRYYSTNNDREAVLGLVGPGAPSQVINGYHAEDLDMNGSARYMGENNDKIRIYLILGNNSLDSLKSHVPE